MTEPLFDQTSVPCPKWCDQPAGHGYDHEDIEGWPARHHSIDVFPEGVPGSLGAVVACEAVLVGGSESGAETFGPATVDVVIGGDSHRYQLTNSQEVATLNASLLMAAAHMVQIQDANPLRAV